MREPPPIAISVVIPCYQEADRVAAAVSGYRACAAAIGLKSELIVVDDGSTDGTSERAAAAIAGEEHLRCLTLPHQGKGAAIRAGVEAASGHWVVLADADWSMSPEQVAALIPVGPVEALQSTPGIWVGCREHAESRRIGEPFYRHLLGRCFNHLVRLLLVRGVSDTQCGFKGFSSTTGKVLCQTARECGWAFDVEFLLLAQRWGQPIHPVSIRWVHDQDSRISPLRDSLHMGWALLRIGFRHGFRFGFRKSVPASPEAAEPQEVSLSRGAQP